MAGAGDPHTAEICAGAGYDWLLISIGTDIGILANGARRLRQSVSG